MRFTSTLQPQRSLFNNMFNSLDIMLTNKCNLTCSFCYIREKNQVSPADEVGRNIRTCEWFMDQYRKDMGEIPPDRRRVQINMYGGEPTVAWDSVQALSDWSKTINDVKVKIGLVTNMVLMDEEKIDYCIANQVSISPSIDGCREVEDMFRVRADGTKVSDLVYANAKILTSKIGGRSCRSTFAPETVRYMFDSVRFVTEELGFVTVNQILAGGVKWSDSDIAIVEEQTGKITDWWLQKMREGKHYSIYYLRNMFKGIWTPVRRRGLCSSGVTHVAVDTDGNMYPCHRFCNADTLPEYKMGNIHVEGFGNESLRRKLMAFDLAEHHKDKCSRCIAVNSCMALCLHEMMLSGNGMFEPLPHYCKVWPIYYREAMRAHAVMDAEKNQLYYRTYRPRVDQRNPVGNGSRLSDTRRSVSSFSSKLNFGCVDHPTCKKCDPISTGGSNGMQ